MKEINDIIRYYDDRAHDYDLTAGYLDKEAEKIRAPMKQRHKVFAKNKNVLEIACGTGYWTHVIAETAKSVLATDVSRTMITIAREKYEHLSNVTFRTSDAYSLENVHGRFNAAYAHWWWSHMPKSKIRDFLLVLHNRLLPGSQVLFSDHLPGYLDTESEVLKYTDEDRIEKRTLKNGKTYLVIKNFPTREEILHNLRRLAEHIDYHEYDKYWELHYTVMK